MHRMGGGRMPCNTGWAGERRPMRLNGRGNDAGRYWIGGGMALHDSGQERHWRGMEAPGTTTGGYGGAYRPGRYQDGCIRLRRLQDWGAHGPGGCIIGGHLAPEVAGPTGSESLRQESVWHRVPAELGS